LSSHRKSGGRRRHKNGMIRCPNFRRFEGRIDRSDRTFGSGAVDVKQFRHCLKGGATQRPTGSREVDDVIKMAWPGARILGGSKAVSIAQIARLVLEQWM